jgi:heme/copper-type cytochrome/quinol oxidase subunit 4
MLKSLIILGALAASSTAIVVLPQLIPPILSYFMHMDIKSPNITDFGMQVTAIAQIALALITILLVLVTASGFLSMKERITIQT